MKLQYRESMKMKGERWDFWLIERAVPLMKEEIATIKELIRNGVFNGYWKGHKVTCDTYSNIIPTISRTQILKALANQLAGISDIVINYQELGTGTNTPSNSDTGLQTPAGGTTRKLISSMAVSGIQMNVTSFWAAGEATGTWREFATFIKGTATSNSGTIFNRAAINITISSIQSLTLDGTVTLN